jgi:adenylate cyclase class 2
VLFRSPSGRETEVKFLVRDLATIENRLGQFGATLLRARTYEVNLRFDTPDRTLQQSARVLRLRRDTNTWITYKGSGQEQDGIISREEIEIEVGAFETAQNLLEALGFEVIFIYEKYRTIYNFEENQVMLDELPYGCFIEIEGEPPAIRNAAQLLQLKWRAALATSYHGLFQRLAEARKLSFRDLTFENFTNRPVNAEDLGVLPAD